MAGYQSATIIEVIKNISERGYLLPAFQREYVWSCEQIERLFDSLMRGYPTSSMLFWRVKGENKNRWKFYEFLDEYREEYHTHNKKASTSFRDDFYAILDGQQRLTSIYLALCGNYDTHKSRKKWENIDSSFHICDFYFNLTGSQESKNSDVKYEFLWLDREDTKEKVFYTDKHNQKWFKCKYVLDLREENGFENFLETPETSLTENEREMLRDFHTLVFNTKDDTKINYYLEEDGDPDRAVDIFIRINSGGTYLDYSDILFSYAIANWQTKDARTEINGLIEHVNHELDFGITKDLILKTFLFLYHNNIKFKIDSFDNGFIERIETEWGSIKECIIQAFKLLKTFGLDKNTLSSNNAVLPVIYYLYHKKLYSEIVDSKPLKDERNAIRKYLLRATVLKPFRSSADSVLANIRKVFIKDWKGDKFFDSEFELFPMNDIENSYKYGSNIDDEFLESLMSYRKGSAEAFAILSLLFHNLDTKNGNLHKDHLHPETKYKDYKRIMKSKNMEPHSFKDYDSLPNLQLLDANENMSKQDKSLKEWVGIECKGKDLAFKNSFLNSRFIPKDVDLSLENFGEFYEKRKALLMKKLKKMMEKA